MRGHPPSGFNKAERFREAIMLGKSRSAILTAALLCSALPAWGQDWTQRLPDGKGKETVAAICAGCHEFFSRLGAGYTPEGWRTVMRMMINQGTPVPPDQIETVTQYLIQSFPEKPKPAGMTIPGPVEVSIKQWPVPTPGSRPHDPLATRDGAIWYTGQLANVLGRLDPKIGRIKEYPLKTPHSGPHGLVEDQDRNIWYTANAAGLIGKLDPKTGEVSEYPMPDPAARDPHTLIFDPSGILWFSVQDANKLGSIDPKTMEIREYPLPDPGARPRRIAITSDDVIWYTDFARGYLGRLDPATGKVTEWPSPG